MIRFILYTESLFQFGTLDTSSQWRWSFSGLQHPIPGGLLSPHGRISNTVAGGGQEEKVVELRLVFSMDLNSCLPCLAPRQDKACSVKYFFKLQFRPWASSGDPSWGILTLQPSQGVNRFPPRPSPPWLILKVLQVPYCFLSLLPCSSLPPS